MESAVALWSATRLASAVRSRSIGSRELLDLHLRRCEVLNRSVNAVVTLDAERAMDAARSADEAVVRGDALGPLHGLPVTIKDAVETCGIRSTGGAVELKDHIPARDAPAVARLKAAGAIVYGKTNVPRWSGDIQTYNELFGTTCNPWDLSRTPGGSSGGPAAAVATGLTCFELGTDIGGSIRIPSGYCGVFGHKPSFGVVPQRGYLDHVGGGLTDADINVFGPLARSADDLGLLLTVLAGANEEDAVAWRLDLPGPRHGDLSSCRVGTWLDDPACEVASDVAAVLEDAAAALARAGARVSQDRPPIDLTDANRLFSSLILPAISISLDPEFGAAVSGSHRSWLELDEQRARLRKVWASWFEDHDALLCPVTPMAAFAHDQTGSVADRTVVINGKPRSHADALAWTGLVGVAYLPSTVVPVGLTPSGLPVGIQVVGPYLADRTTLFIAGELSRATGGFVPPPLATGPELG